LPMEDTIKIEKYIANGGHNKDREIFSVVNTITLDK